MPRTSFFWTRSLSNVRSMTSPGGGGERSASRLDAGDQRLGDIDRAALDGRRGRSQAELRERRAAASDSNIPKAQVGFSHGCELMDTRLGSSIRGSALTDTLHFQDPTRRARRAGGELV